MVAVRREPTLKRLAMVSSVQRKVSNGIAGRRRSIVGSAEIAGQFVPTAMPLDGQRRRITLAEDPASTRPERHFPSGAAQTRIVSVAIIRLDPRKSCALSKG